MSSQKNIQKNRIYRSLAQTGLQCSAAEEWLITFIIFIYIIIFIVVIIIISFLVFVVAIFILIIIIFSVTVVWHEHG